MGFLLLAGLSPKDSSAYAEFKSIFGGSKLTVETVLFVSATIY